MQAFFAQKYVPKISNYESHLEPWPLGTLPLTLLKFTFLAEYAFIELKALLHLREVNNSQSTGQSDLKIIIDASTEEYTTGLRQTDMNFCDDCGEYFPQPPPHQVLHLSRLVSVLMLTLHGLV